MPDFHHIGLWYSSYAVIAPYQCMHSIRRWVQITRLNQFPKELEIQSMVGEKKPEEGESGSPSL
ncbi:hypothetical protein HanXRQr2_Chr13g0567171 [Helianthus annuus]|uniref:Uncharacterized protein n=1 Tax=Helianthus annuus TaxID=4232 RepID=A0A251SN51_HELAN|nr:hypothetical protein HanXRQr2_Chr13g0567171 [Helianthus annuus]KAJ0475392.1 hypothetical protein HanHA300_Chr13g0464931 [Helianthus annuus]KAJ0496196.1 hypothetical protein HanHA89_Chr13g0496961 [Helianthus annuus]KAJ0662270.1 hypothetical protein HanLR1_Chr13g0467541 [Helianthus annuus]KAJ0669801.1 hypothetical protein HanOQP8_Chr13g0466701 [Helianthus annuus]